MYEMNEEMVEYVTTEVKQFYFENKKFDSTLTHDVINVSMESVERNTR